MICAEDEDACFYHTISKSFSHLLVIFASKLLMKIEFQGGNETVFRDCIKSTPGNGDYCLKDEVSSPFKGMKLCL